MLSIRLQRTGRKSLAMYRVIVQDSRRTPTSGNIVAQIGTYNPHTKELVLDTEKASSYLKNGAQPTPRVVSLLKLKKVKIPAWVKENKPSESKTRNPEKLRKNNPASVDEVKPEEESQPDAPVVETAESTEEVVAPIEEPSEESPAEA